MTASVLVATVSLRLGAAEWAVIALYAAAMIALGLDFSRAATRSADWFPIGERSLPWWVIGFANVATYSDSGGGWVWLFYVGGLMYLNQIARPIWMPLVGVFWAKMWRRSGLVTTGELIESRYSGRGDASFRGFYGVYACLGWATVFLGYGTALLAQIWAPLIGWTPLAIVLVFGAVTPAYTLMGGLLGAAYIDVPQFFISFVAALLVWSFRVQEQGSYAAMLERAMARVDLADGSVLEVGVGRPLPELPPCAVEIDGPDGCLELDPTTDAGRWRIGGALETLDLPPMLPEWDRQYAAFADAIDRGRAEVATIEDGFRALELTAACEASARTGEVSYRVGRNGDLPRDTPN